MQNCFFFDTIWHSVIIVVVVLIIKVTIILIRTRVLMDLFNAVRSTYAEAEPLWCCSVIISLRTLISVYVQSVFDGRLEPNEPRGT